MNYYKESEQLLSNVVPFRVALKNLHERKKSIPNITMQKINCEKSADTAKQLSHVLASAEIEREICHTQNTLNSIDTVLKQLKYEERQLLSLWYIEKKSKEIILENLNIESLTTLYKLRNKAVGNFAMLYFGSISISSI